MPELPDITVYVDAIAERVVGGVLAKVVLRSPFVLRTALPPIRAIEGRRVTGIRRIGKRIVLAFAANAGGDPLFLVVHLMIAGRFRFLPVATTGAAPKLPAIALAALEFTAGTLVLTEASKKKRASLHLVQGEAALAEFARGGVDVFAATLAEFRAALTRESHTLKRALTDPRLVDGIGNAYSDEILHRARLSPVTLVGRLDDPDWARLHRACRDVLREWIDRLRTESAGRFPEKVTAFRAEMAVHGRYGQPCPDCGAKVQRIAYAENETNYCASCQTGGKLLADRALSRLLHGDWPRTLDELEDMKAARREPIVAAPPERAAEGPPRPAAQRRKST